MRDVDPDRGGNSSARNGVQDGDAWSSPVVEAHSGTQTIVQSEIWSRLITLEIVRRGTRWCGELERDDPWLTRLNSPDSSMGGDYSKWQSGKWQVAKWQSNNSLTPGEECWIGKFLQFIARRFREVEVILLTPIGNRIEPSSWDVKCNLMLFFCSAEVWKSSERGLNFG